MSDADLRAWDFTAAVGDQGELFARWGENGMRSSTSLEVKTDRASWATGNVYIEYACFKSDQWVPSGIDARHTRAELWAQVIIGPTVIFAPTAFVRRVAEKNGSKRELTEGTHPTRGWILPIPRFVALLVRTAKAWAAADGQPPLPGTEGDPAAPFGRDANGISVAPYGHTKDRKVRLCPGGRRAGGKSIPLGEPLWGDSGYRKDDGYDPPNGDSHGDANGDAT